MAYNLLGLFTFSENLSTHLLRFECVPGNHVSKIKVFSKIIFSKLMSDNAIMSNECSG